MAGTAWHRFRRPPVPLGDFRNDGRVLDASPRSLLATSWNGDFEVASQPLFKIENAIEVLTAIVFRLPHLPDVDQIEDDFAETARVLDPPVIEDGLGQQPKLFNRKLADRFAKFLAG